MNWIRLPRVAVTIVRAAAPGDLVQIQQTADAAVLTVAAPQRVLRVSAPVEQRTSVVEPFTVTAGDLAAAAVAVGLDDPDLGGDLPMVAVRISESMAGVSGPRGTPQTVAIVQATFPDCSGSIDAVEGERASGMTRAVASAGPQLLHDVAQVAAAIGCTAVEFTFAPRLGRVLAEADAGPVSVTVALEGEPREAAAVPMPVVEPDDDPLVFTMSATTPARPARRSPPKQQRLACEDDLPF
jgi:hypothetical protein